MHVIVVGAGLAGLVCALELSRLGVQVTLIEKEAKFGGNSCKASSGINAAFSDEVVDSPDSFSAFARDTIKSGGGESNEALVQVLVQHSPEAVEYLKSFGIDLSEVSQCGGHSAPRTYRAKAAAEGVPINIGYRIMRTLTTAVLQDPRIRKLTACKVVGLLSTESSSASRSSSVCGVQYENAAPAPQTQAVGTSPAPKRRKAEEQGREELRADAVVLATGGYGCSTALLRNCHINGQKLADLPSTNGRFAQGEGLLLAERLGAAVTHMQHIQVHPTSFVDCSDPFAPTNFLAPEALRGCGALLLDTGGRRFCNELARRDQLTAAIFHAHDRLRPAHAHSSASRTSPPPSPSPDHCDCGPCSTHCCGRKRVRVDAHRPPPRPSPILLLNAVGAATFGLSTLNFYLAKKLMFKHSSLKDFCELHHLEEEKVSQTLASYVESAAKGEDRFGKTVFPNVDGFKEEGLACPVYSALVTPAVHYTMGGLCFDEHAQVLTTENRVISNLYAAGEVTGGLHGRNRLAGNSLLECVVFGRIAARHAASHPPTGKQQQQDKEE